MARREFGEKAIDDFLKQSLHHDTWDLRCAGCVIIGAAHLPSVKKPREFFRSGKSLRRRRRTPVKYGGRIKRLLVLQRSHGRRFVYAQWSDRRIDISSSTVGRMKLKLRDPRRAGKQWTRLFDMTTTSDASFDSFKSLLRRLGKEIRRDFELDHPDQVDDAYAEVFATLKEWNDEVRAECDSDGDRFVGDEAGEEEEVPV